jgi:hypothetical protein
MTRVTQVKLFQSGPVARRVRLSAREIVLAIALTLAAVAFVIAALGGGRSETAAVLDGSHSNKSE